MTTDGLTQERMQRAAVCAEAFEALLEGTAPEIPRHGVLAGPAHMSHERVPAHLRRGNNGSMLGDDNLHFAMNVQTLLRLGFAGIARTARKKAERLSGESAAYLRAISRCHEAAAGFAAAHADEARRSAGLHEGSDRERLLRVAENCRALAEREARTFVEAVQLFWFAWCMRGHGTIGRLDQHLCPFYEVDLAAGRLTREEALTILCELWESINRAGTGDTLVNLMIGGQTRDGRDGTNAISYLMIDAALAVRKTEPQLSVRIHAGTPEAFLDKVAQLQLQGHGQGAVYNDDVLVPSLCRLGVPLDSARCYANDGCTEVTIDGESGILFLQMEAVKSLELALFDGEENALPGDAVGQYHLRSHAARPLGTSLALGYRSGDFAAMTSFEEFYEAFLRQYLYQVDSKLDALSDRIRGQRQHGVTAPFLAGTFPKCLGAGDDPFRGGFTVDCYLLFSGSLPTVADGLAAVRKVVFEDRFCSPAELLEAPRANFDGHEELRKRCLAAPKFGNDDDYVDEIAADLGRRFCERVTTHPTPTGKPYWPAFYNFLFNDHAKFVAATPDGRRWKDPIAEHYSPTPGRARCGPTAVIRSAAKGPLADACGSSVFHVSLTRSTAPATAQGQALLRQLVGAAIKLGVAVMGIAIYDVDALRDAKVHPERHEDLVVRVWGFSARFVTLSEDMQDHIIARAIADRS